MADHKVKRGLNLPIQGEPQQQVEPGRSVGQVAVLGKDHVGMRPTMHVSVGDAVRRGQLLFEDKKVPGVRFTAPGAGKVVAVHRGERRTFLSVVIELDAAERSGRSDDVTFRSFTSKGTSSLTSDEVTELLVESGLWVALRARPFSRTADPETRPHSIFVNAMDSNPLAPDLDLALQGRESDLQRGLTALAKLTDGTVFVCGSDRSGMQPPSVERVRHERFRGPHPAGTVGLHIHTLDPVSRGKMVWHVGLQDVLAMGHLFAKGTLDVERVVSLAGPVMQRPRVVRTRLGASTRDLLADEWLPEDIRVISGSVLSGRKAMGEEEGFLGRYHQQVSVLREDRKREFLGWLVPGFDRFSIIPDFCSALLPGKKFPFSTTTYGSRRAIVPIGMFEKVMPLDLEPTFLLKALVTGDLERAEQLGALELDEEDVALCTFVCPGKEDYGPHLREVLTTLEKEG